MIRHAILLVLWLSIAVRPLAAEVSSTDPASLLVFPFVVVDASDGRDTLIRVTNVGASAIAVRCTYVDGSLASGSALGFTVSTTPDRQLAWLASVGLPNDADPLHPIIPAIPAQPFTGTLRCVATGAAASDALIGTATVQRGTPALDSATYAATGFHVAAMSSTDGVLVLGGARAEYDACPTETVLQTFLDGAQLELGTGAALQRHTATTLVLATCSQDPTAGAEAVAMLSLTDEFGQQFQVSKFVREQLVVDLSRLDTDNPAESIFNSATHGSPSGSIHISAAPSGSGLLALALTAYVDPNDASHAFTAATNPQLIGDRDTADQIDLTVPTPMSTPTSTPVATPSPAACIGDCSADQMVAINELITGVNIALGNQPASACSAFDRDRNGSVTINELIAGVNNALNGCG